MAASRFLLKSSAAPSSASSLVRSLCRQFSAASVSSPLSKRAFLITGAAGMSPFCIQSSVSTSTRILYTGGGSFFRRKFVHFTQHVRCLGSRADILMKVSASDGEMKRGSWTCPKCQFINSTQSQRCLGCQEPDSISISRSPTFGFSLGADSHNARRVGLPQSIVKYCVLRSPHIDKKSREQFEMRIKKLYMVVKTQTDDLQKKFFWLKRQRMLGAQYEIIFSYKTRLPLKSEEECP